MKRLLLFFSLLIPFLANAQTNPLTLSWRGNTPVNALDSIAYTYTGITPAGYKWLYPAAYIRANFAPLSGLSVYKLRNDSTATDGYSSIGRLRSASMTLYNKTLHSTTVYQGSNAATAGLTNEYPLINSNGKMVLGTSSLNYNGTDGFVYSPFMNVTNELSTPLIYNGGTSTNTLTLKNHSEASTGFVIDINGLTGGGGASSVGSVFKSFATSVNTPVSIGYEDRNSYSTTSNRNVNVYGLASLGTIGAANSANITGVYGQTGVYSAPMIAAGATGTIDNRNGFVLNFSNASAMNVTNTFGIHLDSYANTGGGAMTNHIGVAMNAQTIATNNTYLLTGTNTPVLGNWGWYHQSAFNNYLGTGMTSMGGGSINTAKGIYNALEFMPKQRIDSLYGTTNYDARYGRLGAINTWSLNQTFNGNLDFTGTINTFTNGLTSYGNIGFRGISTGVTSLGVTNTGSTNYTQTLHSANGTIAPVVASFKQVGKTDVGTLFSYTPETDSFYMLQGQIFINSIATNSIRWALTLTVPSGTAVTPKGGTLTTATANTSSGSNMQNFIFAKAGVPIVLSIENVATGGTQNYDVAASLIQYVQ